MASGLGLSRVQGLGFWALVSDLGQSPFQYCPTFRGIGLGVQGVL